MSSVLEYSTPQGVYAGVFEYDPEADLFHGEVVNTGATLTFQGRSIDELKAALKDTVDEYLDWCAERGKEPHKPFSGNIPLRIGPELHRDLAGEATRKKMSVNQLIKELITRHLAPRGDLTAGVSTVSRQRRGGLALSDGAEYKYPDKATKATGNVSSRRKRSR